MNDLNALLDRAAGPATVPVDARADVTRGHRALSRTRRRRAAGGLLGVAAAGVVGVGAVRLAQPDSVQQERAVESTRTGGISFLAQPFEAGPYTFDQTPVGWEVQGAYPQGVTIAPVGFPDQEPSVLRRQAGHPLRRQPPLGRAGPAGRSDLLGPRRLGLHHDRHADAAWGAHRKRADPVPRQDRVDPRHDAHVPGQRARRPRCPAGRRLGTGYLTSARRIRHMPSPSGSASHRRPETMRCDHSSVPERSHS